MMTENDRTSARSGAPTSAALSRRAAAAALIAGVIVLGSAVGAVAADPTEPTSPTTTMTIVVQVPARATVPTPDLPLPDLPISDPIGSRETSLANTGIDGQQQMGVLAAGALAVLAGTALVARRRRSI